MFPLKGTEKFIVSFIFSRQINPVRNSLFFHVTEMNISTVLNQTLGLFCPWLCSHNTGGVGCLK